MILALTSHKRGRGSSTVLPAASLRRAKVTQSLNLSAGISGQTQAAHHTQSFSHLSAQSFSSDALGRAGTTAGQMLIKWRREMVLRLESRLSSSHCRDVTDPRQRETRLKAALPPAGRQKAPQITYTSNTANKFLQINTGLKLQESFHVFASLLVGREAASPKPGRSLDLGLSLVHLRRARRRGRGPHFHRDVKLQATACVTQVLSQR